MPKKNVKILKEDAVPLNEILSLIGKKTNEVREDVKIIAALNIVASTQMRVIVGKYGVPKGNYKLEGETLKLIDANPPQPTD